MQNRRNNGDDYWDLKQAAVSAALGKSWQDVCRGVLQRVEHERPNDKNIWDASQASLKWRWNKPTDQWFADFLDPLATLLECKPEVRGRQLFGADIASFIAFLKPEVRERAKQAAEDALKRRHATGDGLHCVEPFVHYGRRVASQHHSMEDYVAAGIVDSHAYYASAEGAGIWRDIIGAAEYPQYRYCLDAFERLLADPVWRRAIADSKPSNAIMLGGGGSPAKDLALMKAMLSEDCLADARIAMLLVDINWYMLMQSINDLIGWTRRLPGNDRVHIRSKVCDILELHKELHKPGPDPEPLVDSDKASVFAITGNTVGNLSEEGLFGSLGKVAKTGDLLVVGCGTRDGMTREQVLQEEKQKYKAPEVIRFIRPGIECVVRTHKLQETLEHAEGRVAVDVRDGLAKRLSDVPDSMSVVLTLAAGKREIVLLKSARYSSASLVAFAARHGWESVCTVHSRTYEKYAQFAFRRL